MQPRSVMVQSQTVLHGTHRVPDTAPLLSIVIPTYNERTRLGDLVERVCETFRTSGIAGEIVIVDDNSPDGTGAFAEELAARLPVRVVHRAGKLGLGTAVIDGFAAARGSVFGVMDADLSHPRAVLPRMLEALDRYDADLVIASRYIPGGGINNWPMVRRAMSRFACLIARPLTAARRPARPPPPARAARPASSGPRRPPGKAGPPRPRV